jgi:hypothetical protein
MLSKKKTSSQDNQMSTKVLSLAILLLCFIVAFDAKANCTNNDSKETLPNVHNSQITPASGFLGFQNIPDGGFSDTFKKGAKDAEEGVKQIGKGIEGGVKQVAKGVEEGVKQVAKSTEDGVKGVLTIGTDAAQNTVHNLETIGGQSIKLVEKTGGDIIETTIKSGNDLTATYTKAWTDGTEQARRSFQDTVDAAKAVGNYMSNQAKDLGQATKEISKAAQEGDLIKAMWKFSTAPVQAAEKNFAQATQESSLINDFARETATTYGPGGAAAYAAWSTYHLTGDADLALRNGISSAIMNQTGGVDIPSGTAGEVLKKSAMAGALGGIAVAAAGGDEKAVKEAFLKSSGAVLIQSSTDQLKAFSPKANDAIEMSRCISAKDLDCVSNTTYGRDIKGRILNDKNGKPRIDPNKIDPKQYLGRWTATDPDSPEGKTMAFISKISKLPKSEVIPLKNNQWILTWTLGCEKTIEYGKPAVVLTYVGNNVPFTSKVEYESFITNSVYSCPVHGFTRTVTTTKSQNSCKTIYQKEDGVSQVIWNSQYHPESCAAKAAAFVTNLSNQGTLCSAISKVEHTLSEETSVRVTGTVGGKQVVPGPAEPSQVVPIPANPYRK